MACSTPVTYGSPYSTHNAEKKTRMCRFFLGTRGCRDGDDCLYRHIDDRPTCKYYFSKWGCWNGKWCQYKHSEPESEEVETAKQFYKELNDWLGPAKTADDSIQSTDSQTEYTPPKKEYTTPKPVAVTATAKKLVSRGTQTKTMPDFVNCGECGEEFKSSRTLQQSLERHYIHKLASADFHHLRFFKRHHELQAGEPFCSACGEVFGSIEELLQHMGRSVSFTSGTASVSVRHGHQSWFKQLVQPFVYRDLEVLETEDDMVQCILEIYFIKPPATPVAKASAKTTAKKVPAPVSPMKLARKLQKDVNGDLSNGTPFIHCEECGEIFGDPDGDDKLRDHYANMLARGDGLHVRPLRKWINTQAQCSVCKKTFLSVVALLQHVGSKEKVTNSNQRQSASKHAHLLSAIANVFVGKIMGLEGYVSQEAMKEKLQELTWTREPCHPNEVPSSSDETVADSPPSDDTKEPERRESIVQEPQKREDVDEALQMARYFCRVNEWQAKMSYPEYVKDDQERTRNYGFTVAEVGYLATKGLTPSSRGVFNILNALYRRRRNPLKSPPVSPKVEPPKDKDVKAAPKSPKKDVSFNENTEGPKKKGQDKPEVKDSLEVSESVEELEQGSPTKGQQPKPKRKKRVRRRKKSKGAGTDLEDEAVDAEDKKSSSKGKSALSGAAASANKKKADKKAVIRKRERILSRDIEGKDLEVIMQVHMDGTIFIREKLAEAEEEVIPKDTKDNATLQEAVEQSMHAAAGDSITSRVFVVHDDATIDVILQVAGIPIDTLDTVGSASTVNDTVSTETQIRKHDAAKATLQRDFTEDDSAIIAVKVSACSAVVYKGNQEGDMKTEIMKYLLTATEQGTSVVREVKDEDATKKDAISPPVEQQSTQSGEVVKTVTEENKVVEEIKEQENAISESKPKEQDTIPEKATNQQDTVIEQSGQPETSAEAKPAVHVASASSKVETDEDKTQTQPCQPIADEKPKEEDTIPEKVTNHKDTMIEQSGQPETSAEATPAVHVVSASSNVKTGEDKTQKCELIADEKPKEDDTIPEKAANQQDTVIEQSGQPETSAEAKPAVHVASSKLETDEDKTQTQPCEPIANEDTVKKAPKEDNEPDMSVVAAEDVSESSSQKAVPVTGSVTNEAHAPTDINGNADTAPPSEKMDNEKIVTEVNNNSEPVVGVTTAPSE